MFIKYQAIRRMLSGNKPKVRLEKSGKLCFNEAAVRTFGMMEYDFAALYSDPDAFLVGLELLKDNPGGAMKLRKTRYSCSATMQGLGKQYGILPDHSITAEVGIDRGTGYLVFSVLDEKHEERSAA